MAADPSPSPAPRRPDPPGTPVPLPPRRKPLRYRAPKTTWVIPVVLGFATIGMASVGKLVASRLSVRPAPPPPKAAAGPVIYRSVKGEDAVLVTVEVTPRGAQVLIDGAPAESNPLRVRRGATVHLAAVADGYRTATADFTADRARTVRVKLSPK